MLSLFLYILLIANGFGSGSFLLLTAGLADYFLIFTDWYSMGLLIFILFQFGILRLQKGRPLSMFAAALTALIFVIILCPRTDEIFLLAVIYAACLLYNLAVCIRRRSFSLGLVLFLLLLCDLHVGLANLGAYLDLPGSFLPVYQREVAPRIFWVFYLPSQFLLARRERSRIH